MPIVVTVKTSIPYRIFYKKLQESLKAKHSTGSSISTVKAYKQLVRTLKNDDLIMRVLDINSMMSYPTIPSLYDLRTSEASLITQITREQHQMDMQKQIAEIERMHLSKISSSSSLIRGGSGTSTQNTQTRYDKAMQASF